MSWYLKYFVGEHRVSTTVLDEEGWVEEGGIANGGKFDTFEEAFQAASDITRNFRLVLMAEVSETSLQDQARDGQARYFA